MTDMDPRKGDPEKVESRGILGRNSGWVAGIPCRYSTPWYTSQGLPSNPHGERCEKSFEDDRGWACVDGWLSTQEPIRFGWPQGSQCQRGATSRNKKNRNSLTNRNKVQRNISGKVGFTPSGNWVERLWESCQPLQQGCRTSISRAVGLLSAGRSDFFESVTPKFRK